MTTPALGSTYGRWTVVGEAVVTPKGERKWPCRCQCGTERSVLERSLIYGGSLSCGCMRKEKAAAAIAHDLSGQTFGQLTVLHQAEQQPAHNGIWWTCHCSCGTVCDVPATLLATGRKTHCGCQTQRGAHYKDISGQQFNRLTALYPLASRSSKGSVVWHCRCTCGHEVDVPYNELQFSPRQSCGCQKKEHDSALQSLLTHVAGTSLDMLKSQKIPSNNTTGVRGVYRIRGRYTAKIVFQKKQYYLGEYDRMEDAVKARQAAETMLNAGTIRHYERWKARADMDPDWGDANPIRILVDRKDSGAITVTFLPTLEEDRALPVSR